MRTTVPIKAFVGAAQFARGMPDFGRIARLGGTIWLLLAAILALSVPLTAAEVPGEDRGWGAADHETDTTRYNARVQFYEDEAAKLGGRRQQITGDLNMFWQLWSTEARKGYIEEFDRSFDGIQYRSRVHERKQDENNAKGLFVDFQTNCARCDIRKPDVRERAYNKHLDYLRARNARMAEYNRYLDLRQQQIKANVEFAFEEWVKDSTFDIAYVLDRVAGAIADDFYKSCVEGTFLKVLSDAASFKLTGKTVAGISDLAVDCARDVGYGALANALLFTLQKQFIDDMVRRGIHKEVAEYWMFEILTPANAGKLSGATKVGQTSAKLLAREVKAQFKHQLGQAMRTGLRAKFLQNPWTIGAKPTSDAGLLKIRDQAINKLAKQKQDEILKSKNVKLQMQGYYAGKFLAKYVERVLPLVAAYYDFPELERLEVPKYWEIRRCLEARRLPARGPNIKAVLKRSAEEYREFKRKCREQEQANCPANIEKARALIEEAAQVRVDLSRKAGSARAAAIAEGIRAFENELRNLSDEVNRATAKNADVCAMIKSEQQVIKNLINRIRDDAGKVAPLRDAARQHADRACAADAVAAAETEAGLASEAAKQAKRIGNTIGEAHAGVKSKFGAAGEPIDLSEADSKAERIATTITDLKNAVVAASQQRAATVAKLDGGAKAIELCTKQADRNVRRLLDNERRRLKALSFAHGEQISRLTGGLANAKTWLGEMRTQQETSLACFKTVTDPKSIIGEIGSWSGAVDLMVGAALGSAARADGCVQEKKDDDIATAKAALNSCKFKDSRRLIAGLPEGPQRAALVARWNKTYESERKARDRVREAMTLENRGEYGRAIGELHEASDLSSCDSTRASIDKAIARIRKERDEGNRRCRAKYGTAAFAGRRRHDGQFECKCQTGFAWNTTRSACIRPLPTVADGHSVCRRQFGPAAYAAAVNPNRTFQCKCGRGFLMKNKKCRRVTIADGHRHCRSEFGRGARAVAINPNGTFKCQCRDGYRWTAGNKRCTRLTLADGHAACQRQFGSRSRATSYRGQGSWNCYTPRPQPPPPPPVCPPGYNPYGC